MARLNLHTEIRAIPFPQPEKQGATEDAFAYVNRCISFFAEWLENCIEVDISVSSEKTG